MIGKASSELDEDFEASIDRVVMEQDEYEYKTIEAIMLTKSLVTTYYTKCLLKYRMWKMHAQYGNDYERFMNLQIKVGPFTLKTCHF